MTYHEDEEARMDDERHAGIVLREGKILMMHRVKNGYEYYVFPGGHRRQGEKGEETVEREVYEETGIEVKVEKLAFSWADTEKKQKEFYYICSWVSGEEPRLVGEEKVRNSPENFFEPLWLPVSEIPKINTLPVYAKEWVMVNLPTEEVGEGEDNQRK